MKKILLIEDNTDICSNIADILVLSNYEVIIARNGKTGLEKAIKHQPDLIICDIMLPVLDGYGVLYAIHKNEATQNIPFIFLTAKTERADYRKGMELGADDYITKPFSGTELLNAVASRIKKLDKLKHALSAGNIDVPQSLGNPSAKNSIRDFIAGRNITIFKKKQIIYSAGSHPNRLYYILKGKIKAFKVNEDGKEFVTGLFKEGDFLGYVALLEEAAYKDTTMAIEETELAIIPKEDFNDLINKNPQVMKTFIQLMANTISENENLMLSLAYNSLRKKVADALLLLQKKYLQGSVSKFIVDMNRESLASVAGTAKESLIRTLGDFKNEKLIEIGADGRISIINLKKLEQLAN